MPLPSFPHPPFPLPPPPSVSRSVDTHASLPKLTLAVDASVVLESCLDLLNLVRRAREEVQEWWVPRPEPATPRAAHFPAQRLWRAVPPFPA